MLQLGGRAFRVVKVSTVEHDVWMMGKTAAAGMQQVTMLPGETPESFATRLTGEFARSGLVLVLLGGALIPAELEDLEWSPAVAAQTAAFLGGLTDPADKQLVLAQVASLVAGFFETGLMSCMTSRNSSAGAAANGQPVLQPASRTAAH